MKRILLVLALLMVGCALAFSVTGSVYTRLLANNVGSGSVSGYYMNEPWANTIQDVRVGRQGTGVTMNFDAFSFTYKLRGAIPETWTGGDGFGVIRGNFSTLATTAANRTATSPGYFRIDGLKLGTVDLGVGAAWWTWMESQDIFQTNALGATNSLIKGSASYNNIALDLTYSIQVGDNLHIWAAPWNKTYFAFYTGSDNVNDMTTTNNATLSGYNAIISCNIDYSMEALSLTVEAKAVLSGQSSTTVASLVTNTSTASSMEIGAVAKVGYTVSEILGVFADVGLVVYGGSSLSYSGATTNANSVTSGMQIPLMGGVSLTPAPVLTFNIGLGYALMLNNQVVDNTGATNTTVTDSRFQSSWDTYEMHGYHKPLVKFGADTKFAGDFSAGLRFIIMLNNANGTGDNGGMIDQASHDKWGYSKVGNWLNFVNIPDWDGNGGSSAYLGYDKDNFSTKLWVNGNGGNGGGGASGLLGMFGCVDVTIKF